MLNIPSLKKITEKSIMAIGKLKHLEILNVSDCDNIKTDHLIYLKECKLKTLSVNNIRLTDADLQVLNYLNDIEYLSIESKFI
jgi:hypothetical protein